MKTEIVKDRRLRILQVLTEAHGYSCNCDVLRNSLPHFGHNPTYDELLTDICWLEEQGLVRQPAAVVMLTPILTERGADVAQGRADQYGVASARLTPDSLFAAAFDRPRDPRSPEYKAGVRAALEYRLNKTPIRHSYPPASAASDAYHAGIEEGHSIWRGLQ